MFLLQTVTSSSSVGATAAAVATTVQPTAGGQVLQTAPTTGGLQIVHQIVTPSGEVQNIPVGIF